jgi:hypothetical protein
MLDLSVWSFFRSFLDWLSTPISKPVRDAEGFRNLGEGGFFPKIDDSKGK